MARVQDKLGSLDESPFEDLSSPDKLVEMRMFHVDGQRLGTVRGTTVVDSSIESCAAWDLDKMSRHQVKAFYKFGGLERTSTRINDHHSVLQAVIDLRVPGFLPREWVMAVIWRWQDEDTLKVVVQSTDFGGVPRKKDYLRTTATNLFEYKRLQQLGGGAGAVQQTLVTMTAQVDVGENIPSRVANRGGMGTLMLLSRMRTAFDKSREVDVTSASRLVDMIRAHGGEYTDGEQRIIEEGRVRLKMFEGLKTRTLKMDSPSTKAKVAFEENDSHAWGWATTTVMAT